MRPASSVVLLLAASASVLGGCGSSDATSPALELSADTLTAQAARIGAVALLPAVQGLLGAGARPPAFTSSRRAEDRERPLPPTSMLLPRRPNVAAAVIGAGAWLPPGLLGKTFVRVNGAWVADTTRTDAPADGIRVVLYQRLSDGSLGTTVVGLLEAVDSSAADGSAIVGIVRLLDAGGLPLGGWRFVGSGRLADGAQSVTGTLGPDDHRLQLADTMTAPLDTGTPEIGGIFMVQHTEAPFANASVERRSGGLSGAEDDSVLFEQRVRSYAHELRRSTTRHAADSAGVATSVYIDGRLVALVTPDGPMLHTPDGDPIPLSLHRVIGAADALAFTAPSGFALHTSVESLLLTLAPPFP
jgi:hypothetical protein